MATLACLACLAALASFGTLQDAYGTFKAAAALTLLVAGAWSPWSLSARTMAAILFASFAAYNFSGAMAGRVDCGCFPVRVPPALTGFLDICFAGWFTWRSRSITRRRWWMLAAYSGVIMGAIWGLLAPESPTSTTPTIVERTAARLVAAPLPEIGEQLYASDRTGRSRRMTLFIHRNSCLNCQEQRAFLLATLPPSRLGLPNNNIQVELDQGKILALDGSPVAEVQPLLPLLERARFWQLPVLITITDGKVESVEDLSRLR